MGRYALLTLLALAISLAGCADERRYAGDGIVQVALTSDTPPAFALEDAELFVVETRVELPIRDPGGTVLSDLRAAAEGYDLPYDRLPFVTRGDIEVQVELTLANLDDEAREVAVILNGFNEFHEYTPGVQVVDDEAVTEFSQWEKLYALEPRQRLTITVREEELDEVAVDLATVVNGADNPNNVVFFENKSDSDERNRPFIPEIVPGLMGVRLGLRSTAAGNVLLEGTVRVRDIHDMLTDDGPPYVVSPEPFMPSSVTGDDA